MRARIAIYIACLVLAIFISGSIIIAPRLIEAGGVYAKWGTVVYLTCHGLCHQMPERSYFWNGTQMAVCHRCIGIYGGALLGLIIYPFTPFFRKGTFPSLRLFLIFIIPVALDLFGETLRIYPGHPYIRTLTGALAAFICSFYAVPGLEEFLKLIAGNKQSS